MLKLIRPFSTAHACEHTVYLMYTVDYAQYASISSAHVGAYCMRLYASLAESVISSLLIATSHLYHCSGAGGSASMWSRTSTPLHVVPIVVHIVMPLQEAGQGLVRVRGVPQLLWARRTGVRRVLRHGHAQCAGPAAAAGGDAASAEDATRRAASRCAGFSNGNRKSKVPVT